MRSLESVRAAFFTELKIQSAHFKGDIRYT